MSIVQQRRQQITELVNRNGQVTFTQLKQAFPNTSEMTLRTDLRFLDESGLLIRIHGGAKSIDTVAGTDGPLARRIICNTDRKREIAEKALALLCGKTSVFLDSGSTTTLFSKYFPDERRQIFTCSLSCATELSVLTKPEVYLLGGRLNRDSLSVAGSRSVLELQKCHFEICFLGATGFHPDTGFGCESEEDCVLKQIALERSSYRVALLDSSKFGRTNTHCICPVQGVDAIVSDGGLLPEQRVFFLQQNITVF